MMSWISICPRSLVFLFLRHKVTVSLGVTLKTSGSKALVWLVAHGLAHEPASAIQRLRPKWKNGFSRWITEKRLSQSNKVGSSSFWTLLGSWFDMSCWEVDLLTGCIVSAYFFSPTLTKSIGEVTLRAKVAWRIRPWAWHMDAHGTMRCKTRKQFRRNWHSFLSFEPRSFCIVFEGQDSPMRHAPCAAPEIHVLTWFGPLLEAPNSQIVASQSSQSSQSSLEVVSWCC